MSMRKPTSPEVAYAWHAKALEANGDKAKMPPIHENDPKPGWYMRRLIAKGPYVPCRIWLEADVQDGELLSPERLLCEVDGQRRDAGGEWTWLAGKPITEDKYMDMLAGHFTTGDAAENPPLNQLSGLAETRAQGDVENPGIAPEKPSGTLF